MSNYIHIDGKDIEISKETTDRLKKELIPERTFKKGDKFYDPSTGVKGTLIQNGSDQTISMYCEKEHFVYCPYSFSVINKTAVTLAEIKKQSLIWEPVDETIK